VTLTIHKEENDQRELQLKVEVSEDQVEQAMRKKARELGRDLRFPGFRKGKVPYRVVLQRVGRNAVRAEAVDDIVQTVFAEALDEAEIDPYGRPTLDEMEIEPLVLQFTVPLEPLVKLGEDYRAMRREIEPVNVTDEAVEEALEQIQIQHQTTEPVDRPIEAGDLITVSGKGELAPASPTATEEDRGEDQGEDQEETPVSEPELLFDQEHLELVMDAEKLFPGTSFVDNLVGQSAGDEVSFTVTFPANYEEEELAGRDASFDLSIIDVKSRDLPPLDDELAKLDGDYETMEDMRAGLSEQLQVQAQNQAKEDLIESTIDDLLEDTVIRYPPAAVEMEIDEMIESFRNQITRSGWEFADYLTIQGSTEESLREDFRENAETRLQRRLVLRQFMLDEKLRVEAEDVEAMIDERTGSIENEELRQQMHEFYLQGAGLDMISSEVLSNKVYERIVAILSGQAPDLAELDRADEEDVVSEEE
jgi:trigger factor